MEGVQNHAFHNHYLNVFILKSLQDDYYYWKLSKIQSYLHNILQESNEKIEENNHSESSHNS